MLHKPTLQGPMELTDPQARLFCNAYKMAVPTGTSGKLRITPAKPITTSNNPRELGQ